MSLSKQFTKRERSLLLILTMVVLVAVYYLCIVQPVERTLAELEGKSRLLLHVCCAPCLAAALPRLGDKFDVTYWFYDPNIWPESEYDKRLSEVARYLKESGAPGQMQAAKGSGCAGRARRRFCAAKATFVKRRV